MPGIVRGQRFAAVAVAATEESDAFAFAIVDEAGAPHHPFMVEGRMFDPDDPHEAVVNEAGAAAFGVRAGDRLVLGTIGWDRLDEYLERSAAFVERTGPVIEVTVTGINRTAVDIAQQDDPFLTLTPAFVARYGDRVINCPCIDNFDAALGREDEALAGVSRLYEPLGYEVDLEEGGALPEHVANGIDVEVAAMWLLALAAGIAGRGGRRPSHRPASRASSVDRDIETALGATTRQQTVAGVLALAPAIVVGAVGAVLLATGLSALTPRGLARRAEIDPGMRIDPVVLTIGAAVILGLGGALLVAATRRSLRPRPSASPRFVALPAGVGATGLLGIALATRPVHRGRLIAGGAIVATAMGVAGVLGVWSFEAGRDRLVADGRLFGVDADLAWRGAADDVDAAVAAARSSGVDAVGVRFALDSDLTLTGPGGSATGNPSAVDVVTGWAGPTIVRGRTPAGPDEVALGDNVMAELDIDLGHTVRVGGPGGDGVLRVVGEVVAWGVDEVDDGFEVSMDGMRALARLSCDGRFGCDPTVQSVVARSDGQDGRRRAGGGRVRGRSAAVGDRQPRRGRAAAMDAGRVPRHPRRRRAVARIRDRAARSPSGHRDRAGARAHRRRRAIGRSVDGVDHDGGGRSDRSPGRDARRAARVGQDRRPARRRGRAWPPVVGPGPHHARRLRHNAGPRRGPRPSRRPRPADPPRRMMPRRDPSPSSHPSVWSPADARDALRRDRVWLPPPGPTVAATLPRRDRRVSTEVVSTGVVMSAAVERSAVAPSVAPSAPAFAPLRPAYCLLVGPIAVALALVGLAVAASDEASAVELVRPFVVALWAVAGLALGVRRRHDRLAPIVLAGAVVGGAGTLAAAMVAHRSLDGVIAVGWDLALRATAALLPAVAMHLLFGLADGRLATPIRRRAVVTGYLAAAVVGAGLMADRDRVVIWPVALLWALALGFGIHASHVRYVKAGAVDRRRMQWIGWGMAVATEATIVVVALRLLTDWPRTSGPSPSPSAG